MSCAKDCRQDFTRHAKNRVAVQSQALVKDSYGSATNTWTAVGTYWAWIKPMSSYEQYTSQQLESSATHKFIIRFQSALKNTKITGGYRIVFDSRIFNIVGIKNLDNDLKSYGTAFQEIQAEENTAEKA